VREREGNRYAASLWQASKRREQPQIQQSQIHSANRAKAGGAPSVFSTKRINRSCTRVFTASYGAMRKAPNAAHREETTGEGDIHTNTHTRAQTSGTTDQAVEQGHVDVLAEVARKPRLRLLDAADVRHLLSCGSVGCIYRYICVCLAVTISPLALEAVMMSGSASSMFVYGWWPSMCCARK
jgi:hypothetical protein